MELIEVTPEGSAVPVFIEKLTATEQKKRKEDIAKGIAEQEALQAEQDAKIAARASALAKLAALGLTEEEIGAL
jgi:TctA family transporter